MILEKDPYYEVGNSIEDLVVSQSSLSKIDPRRNGSPRKFKEYIEGNVEKTTVPMLRGQIFHLYCEDKDKFKVSEAVKPAAILGEVADILMVIYYNSNDEGKKQMLISLDKHILHACRIREWNKTWGDSAIIKNASPVVTAYIEAMTDPSNIGKIILTQTMKIQIEGCITGLENNEFAKRLLFWKDEFANIQYFKELAIFWTDPTTGLKCKAKLDDLIINHKDKLVLINDPKTTGGSAYNFEGTFKQYRLDIQFAMYTRAVLAKFPELKDYKFQYRNIVVETQGLFECVCHRWGKGDIEIADESLTNLLLRVKYAKDTEFKKSLEENQGGGEVLHKHIENYVTWR
jgi:hypothetical protein